MNDTATTVQTTNSNVLLPGQPVQRKTLQETIRDIETQIGRFEQTEKTKPLDPRQEDDLKKLRDLLSKAYTEQERVRNEKIRQQEVQLQLAKSQSLQQQLQLPPAIADTGRSSRTTAMADTRYNAESVQVLNKKKIQDLVKEIDPNTQLDDDVEEMLLQIADDFIENIVTAGCQLAKHRKSSTLEVKDVLLHLERNWNMWIPGYTSEENRQPKRPAATEAHKQRMALIRKTLKK